jgi:hypothetical protein
MANPNVEKLKEIGLRYGDKAAVVLTSLVFVLCFGLALSKKSIETTPDQIKKDAETADSNLNRRREPEEIIKTLESGGIKPTDFAKQAEESGKTVLVADAFKPDREWVTPEPGAGLIRDTPVLIAPTDLFAYPGRGGALLFALDEQGNRIPDTEKKEAPKEERRGRRNRRNRMMGMGGYGGMMGGGGGYGGMMGGMGGRGGRRAARKSQSEIEREQKAETEQRKRDMAAKLAGRDEAPKTKEEAEKKAEGAGGPPSKEIVKGLRWIAITGVLDHGKLVANYREALKTIASPHYARLDLQRQIRQKDGSWSDWEDVDAERNLTILDNLPEEDEELTPENVRPENLVDPLPFLKAGLWEKVHIASLVPKERKEVAPPPTMGGPGMTGGGYGAMMMRGMMGGKGGMMGGPGGMMSGGGGSGMMRGGYGGMMGGPGGMMSGGGSGMMRGMMGGKGGMMGGYGGMMGGGGDTGSFWRSEEKRVMIRALDFTPEPDNDYRYRVRIVVFNPNHNHDDVNHDVDKKATELFGPWSQPTDEVTMPADAAAYAMGTLPANPKSDIKARFQVIRFDPTESGGGAIVPAFFEAQPGEVIGEVRTRDVPVSDGTGKKAKSIDFNTHQIVLDAAGGLQGLPSGMPGAALERPLLTLLLKPDGSVLARNQADDTVNEVRKDIARNYDREIKDSTKKRETAMGSGYGGMMGMMRGMMGMGGGK